MSGLDKEVLYGLIEESRRSREALLKKTEALSRKADELRDLIENNSFAQKILEVLKNDSPVDDPSHVPPR
jgi:hypothetical protein